MNEPLHSPSETAAAGPPTERRKITDVRVLAALAHPVRIGILHLLLSVGHRTATQCAEVVDASPSACSYHLRHLERFGLVERVGATGGSDGRMRRWQAVASGFDFGEPTGSPELVAASAALTAVGLDENQRLARHYLANERTLPIEWQTAAAFSTYALLVSPAELAQVTVAIDAIVRPFRATVRSDVPADARPVRVSLDAFPRTDLADPPTLAGTARRIRPVDRGNRPTTADRSSRIGRARGRDADEAALDSRPSTAPSP